MRTVLICDFDDTVVTVDTGALILDTLGDRVWREYEDMYDLGKLSIEETIVREFSTVRGTKAAMLRAAESARFRPGFERLLEVYQKGREPFVIASYGIDFCIRRIIGRIAPRDRVVLYAPKSRMTATGVEFSFPKLRFTSSVNLKDDAVETYKRRGRRVAYVGDGPSDLPALKKADLGFAIRGSKLAKACRREGVAFTEITSFDAVTDAVFSRT